MQSKHKVARILDDQPLHRIPANRVDPGSTALRRSHIRSGLRSRADFPPSQAACLLLPLDGPLAATAFTHLRRKGETVEVDVTDRLDRLRDGCKSCLKTPSETKRRPRRRESRPVLPSDPAGRHRARSGARHRLGGWNCYYKPPGPKTMTEGWKRLAERLEGYSLAMATKHV